MEQSAQKAGIALSEETKATETVVVNPEDDWLQLLESSSIGKKAKALFKSKVESFATTPDAATIWPVLKTINKYYTANVRNANNMSIVDAQNEALEGRQLDPNVDGVKIHQEVALQVLYEKIRGLNENLQLSMNNDLHPRFQELYLQRLRNHSKQPLVKASTVLDGATDPDKALGDKVTDGLDGRAQFKRTFVDVPAKGLEGLQVGPLVFRKWNLNTSVVVDFTKQATLANLSVQEDLGAWSDIQLSAFRQTVDMGAGLKSLIPKNLAITPLSVGKPLLGKGTWCQLILKSEVPAIRLETLLEKALKSSNPGEVFVMNLRLQVKIDLLKAPKVSGAAAALSDKLSLEHAEIKFSFGVTVNADINQLKTLAQLAKQGTKKAVEASQEVAEAVKELRQKTAAAREQLMKNTDELKSLAEEVLDKKKKPNKEALKKVTEQLQKHSDELKEIAEKFAQKGQVAKEAAEKVVQEVGEAVAKKLGPRVLGFMAKVGARAVPGLGQAMLLYDVVSLGWAFSKGIYDLYQDVSNGSVPWEERFDRWLRSW